MPRQATVIRLPSHQAAPFGAIPFSFAPATSWALRVLNGNEFPVEVLFNGDVAVPEGMAVEITKLQVYAGFDAFQSSSMFTGDPDSLGARWRLEVNGKPVPGFTSRKPGGIIGAPAGSALGEFELELTASGYVMAFGQQDPPLVHLQQRDRLVVVFDNTAGLIGFFYSLSLQGYLYTARRRDDDARGHMSD